jgi:tetratricopeptide (TPR) repeat protein
MLINIKQLVQVKTLVQSGQIAEVKMLLGQIATTMPNLDTVSTEYEANQAMEVRGALGKTLKDLGQPELAVSWYKHALQIDSQIRPQFRRYLLGPLSLCGIHARLFRQPFRRSAQKLSGTRAKNVR